MKHFQYSVMTFVEELRMGHQNFGGNIIFLSGPPSQLLYETKSNFVISLVLAFFPRCYGLCFYRLLFTVVVSLFLGYLWRLPSYECCG